jgi:hypothetical protein
MGKLLLNGIAVVLLLVLVACADDTPSSSECDSMESKCKDMFLASEECCKCFPDLPGCDLYSLPEF